MSPNQTMRDRERATCLIEKSVQSFWESGEAVCWFSSSDLHLREITKTVCGPELERLVRATSFADGPCVDMFRFGADLYGELPCSGSGTKLFDTSRSPVELLRSTCYERNKKLVNSLKNDRFSDEFLFFILADVELGRMTHPI